MKLIIVITMFLIGILSGALAGYSIVQLYIQQNLLWIITFLPWVFLLIFFGYRIRIIKNKINKIEVNFKNKYGFEIYDREPFDNYVDSLIGNKNNRN